MFVRVYMGYYMHLVGDSIVFNEKFMFYFLHVNLEIFI